MRKILFIICSFARCLGVEIEILEYNESLIKDCIKVKDKNSSIVFKDEQHTVYLDHKRNHYIKLYQPNEKRTTSWKKAYERGVFEDVTALKAILFDEKGMFRGYISYRCRPLYPYILKEETIMEIDPTFHDFYIYLEMIELMREKIKETGFFYGDCSLRNIGILNDKCVLFDLDEIVELDELVKMKDQNLIIYIFSKDELKTLAEEYIKMKGEKAL